ncbi:MAG: hypothetical protein ACI8PT_004497 [Gammaproteobacteria bacterium]|jgi:hypothetical protein
MDYESNPHTPLGNVLAMTRDCDETDSNRCLAKTRGGTPCRAWKARGRERCKNHGGLSTGPTTDAGRRRSLSNLTQYRDGTRELPDRRPPEYDITYLDI